jgi:hypothetical protein
MRFGKTILAVLVVMFIAGAGYSHAEGELSIQPGLYKVTSTTKSNLDKEPRERTLERCIAVSTIEPETLLPDKENCSISNLKSEKNNASFDMTCNQPDGTKAFTGHAEYSTTETTFTYKFDLKGPYQGKELVLNSEGKATRIGACEAVTPPAAE